MIEILSTREPSVSATLRSPFGCRLGRFGRALASHDLAKCFVDALDQIVALLIERVDGALRGRHLTIVRDARFVFLVPQLDVRRGEASDQVPKSVVHRRKNIRTAASGVSSRR